MKKNLNIALLLSLGLMANVALHAVSVVSADDQGDDIVFTSEDSEQVGQDNNGNNNDVEFYEQDEIDNGDDFEEEGIMTVALNDQPTKTQMIKRQGKGRFYGVGKSGKSKYFTEEQKQAMKKKFEDRKSELKKQCPNSYAAFEVEAAKCDKGDRKCRMNAFIKFKDACKKENPDVKFRERGKAGKGAYKKVGYKKQ